MLDGANTIPEGDVEFTTAEATEALLKKWGTDDEEKKPVVPSEPTADAGAPEVQPETAEPEGETKTDQAVEDAGEKTEKDPEEAPKHADDDLKVVIKVGEEEHQVSVKDLKRLYGQEASLTRKSQAVAEQTKAVVEAREKYVSAMAHEAKKAEARFAEYRKIDWALLQARVARGEVAPKQFADLRRDAEASFADYKYYVEGVDREMKEVAQTVQKRQAELAEACVRELKDPNSPHHIEGWNAQAYDDLREFAVAQGIPSDTINATVDPVIFKLLKMAKGYVEMRKAGEKKLAMTPKVPVTPTKVLTPGAGQPGVDPSERGKLAMQRLRKDGKLDDAAAALMARWGDK